MVGLNVDVIVCSSGLVTRAAKEATTSIPLVMVGSSSPVESGLGVTLFHAKSQPNDLTPAFAALARERADAIFAASTPSNFTYRRTIAEFAARNRLPASYPYREPVDDGGLMSYGPSQADLFRRAAGYVDKILKGAKPADLPVE